MQIIVFRGKEGWCDRLEVLAHCFQYCTKFDAWLCVDWDDDSWGGGDFDFNDCFEIKGIDTITKKQALDLVASGKFEIRPSGWDFYRMKSPLNSETMSDAYIGEFMNNPGIKKCNGDILVTNGRGVREWHYIKISTHLCFKHSVIEHIKQRLSGFISDSIVVHLRGTDRPDKEDFTGQTIEKLKDRKEEIYAITDDRRLWDRFHTALPKSRLVNPDSTALKLNPSQKGSHLISSVELHKLGITKWDLMIDSLVDWVALVCAKEAHGRKESKYFKMARGIHRLGEGELKKLFNGFLPKKTNECK